MQFGLINVLVVIKKYEFFIRKTDFVRFVIKLGHISIDLKKIKAIVSWQEPENVIQFGLINALVTFQKRINSILGEHLNNIIIYLMTKEEHGEYIKWVLKRLQEEQMLVVIKKYKFFIRKTNFIRFIIKLGHISMDLKKIKAIVSQ